MPPGLNISEASTGCRSGACSHLRRRTSGEREKSRGADGRIKHIPVIVVSASSLKADEKESYEAGADAFLHKAFDMEQFREELRPLLGRWF